MLTKISIVLQQHDMVYLSTVHTAYSNLYPDTYGTLINSEKVEYLFILSSSFPTKLLFQWHTVLKVCCKWLRNHCMFGDVKSGPYYDARVGGSFTPHLELSWWMYSTQCKLILAQVVIMTRRLLQCGSFKCTCTSAWAQSKSQVSLDLHQQTEC